MSRDTEPYTLPLLLALSVHIFILIFLLVALNLPVTSSASSEISSSQPIIHAVAVSQKVLDDYEAQKAAEIRQQQLQAQLAQEKMIRQQEALRQQQLQKIQMEKMQKQLEAQRQAAAEMAKQKAIAAQKAAAEKAATQKAAKQAQQKAERKMLQKDLAKEIQKELASDTAPSSASASHAPPSPSSSLQNQGVIDKYKVLIIQAISSQWIVPPHLPDNISCELEIRLAPGGEVLQVSVTKSSGNPVLDNSAIAAVHKASPLPVPTEGGLFDQFRELHLTVKPDGSVVA